eukprot:gene17768-23370_t
MASPSRSLSPVNTSPKKEVTRYGTIKQPEITFGYEERFLWQKPQYLTDVTYDPPNAQSQRGAIFGTASREGADVVNPDDKKRSNGPGSYDFSRSFDFNSEYVTKKAARFSGAPRQSMALKTPSPGAIYNIDKVFYNGPDKFKGIGFSTSKRKPLSTAMTSADAEMLMIKLPSVTPITIAKKIPIRLTLSDAPGPIYNVHKKVDFRTGPSYSFGNGRGQRFNNLQFLPEID